MDDKHHPTPSLKSLRDTGRGERGAIGLNTGHGECDARDKTWGSNWDSVTNGDNYSPDSFQSDGDKLKSLEDALWRDLESHAASLSNINGFGHLGRYKRLCYLVSRIDERLLQL